MVKLGDAYLALYNLASVAGWTYVNVLVFSFLARESSTLLKGDLSPLNKLEAETFLTVTIVQCCAVLEVFHAAIGLVRASAATTAIQVASRVWMVLCVCWYSEESRQNPFYALMVMSWGLVEVPRYLFLLVNLLSPNNVPYPLLWLRYSLFAILYPTGISGEVGCSIYSLWTYLFTSANPPPLTLLLPNQFNLLYHHGLVIVGILVAYIPLSPVMYSHMVKQRAKKLGTGAKKAQ